MSLLYLHILSSTTDISSQQIIINYPYLATRGLFDLSKRVFVQHLIQERLQWHCGLELCVPEQIMTHKHVLFSQRTL